MKKLIFDSATIAGTYFFGVIGLALDTLAAFPEMLDDTTKNTIASLFGADPAHTGRVMFVMSMVLFAARMRSLRKKL